MASSSSQAIQILTQYPHRTPLDGDQIRALCNALASLNRILGDDNAVRTSIYCTILRLLKAHVTPFPINAPVTFAQVQAARLQLLAEKLLSERKPFPPQLTTAIREGLVSGFDPATHVQIPPDHQKQQLAQQQLADRNQILEERKHLQSRQADFSRTRHACVNAMRARERQQAGPDPDLFVPWERRCFKVDSVQGVQGQTPVYAPLDTQILTQERQRFLHNRTQTVVNEISTMLRDHRSGKYVLSAHQAALLETRARHVKLLSLQAKMRQNVWEEHQLTERDGKRGNKGRARTLKQLQREYEKVERARTRQIESEERDARRKRQAWMNAMVEHLNKFRSYHRDVVRRGMRAVTKAVLKHHEEVARNTSRAEREAERARIQKLKEDDEEGYLELVRQTKNTRLLELLDQTDKYLKELGAVVKEERAKSGVVEYENGREKQGSRVNYYEIAHAIKEDVREQSSLLVGGKLKEYQLQGIQWMVSLYNNRLNGILADEMGLGKTIQTLGLIAHLMEMKDNPGPYLIIVPLSTISNWEMEFARWAPAIRVIVFKGDAKTRRKLFEDIIEKKSFNVCLVTYEYVVRGKNLLKRIEWQHLIIDEGHRIKNHESRLSSVLHDHYRSRNRLLLTGTPLQNSLTELWALLNFLLPNVFRSAESFESWFAAPFAQMGVGNVANTDEQAQLTEEESLLIIRRLHQVLRPFLLRRLKSDVLRMGEQLPEKQEHNILCEMSAWQKSMYVKILKSDRLLFTDRHGRQRYDKLPNPAVQLRKCVNHPYLFFADHASKIVDSPQLWRSSGKFDMLDSMIVKLLRTGHRLLIFNQMTKVVDLQERLLRYRNIPFYRLDGTTSTDERKQMVNDFNDEETDVHVFLLTTRAGGLGVNLQTADTVIIFDSDWNPSMDQQAQDRAHRIGQRKEVLVIRLLTAKSIEENVLERASFKRGLEKKIIRAGMFDEQSKDSERQAMLRELLRVEGGSDDDHPEDGVPTDEEINRIMARNEGEFEKFMKIDQERADEIAPRQRLIADREIPEWATKVPKALIQKAKTSGAGNWARDIDGVNLEILNEPKKRRAATTNVSYGVDQLSERQYIKLMERSEAGEELSYDALRAVTRRRKRRRKDETTKAEGSDEEGNKEESSFRLSKGLPNDNVPKGSSASEVIVASKSLNTDVKSYDDELTEGGDQSAGPSVGDDLVIEDDDDEDIVAEVGNGLDSGKDDGASARFAGVDSDSTESSRSGSVTPRLRSRGHKRIAERSSLRESDQKRPRRTNVSINLKEGNSRNNIVSKELPRRTASGEGSENESSESSVAPIRRPISRKRPKVSIPKTRGPPNVEDVSLSEDDPSRPSLEKKLRSKSENKITRIQRLDMTGPPKETLQAPHFEAKSPPRQTGKGIKSGVQPGTPWTDGLSNIASEEMSTELRHQGSTHEPLRENAASAKPLSMNSQNTTDVLNQEKSVNHSASKSSKTTTLSPSLPKSALLMIPRKAEAPLPKLSSSPLTKRPTPESTKQPELNSKTKDPLLPRKASSPPKTIDEAALPVLRKIPLSVPKKDASPSKKSLTPNSSSHPHKSANSQLSNSISLAQSKPLPSLPSSSVYKSISNSKSTSLTKPSSSIGLPAIPGLHSRLANASRPVLSSIALISSTPSISSKLLLSSTSKDLLLSSKDAPPSKTTQFSKSTQASKFGQSSKPVHTSNLVSSSKSVQQTKANPPPSTNSKSAKVAKLISMPQPTAPPITTTLALDDVKGSSKPPECVGKIFMSNGKTSSVVSGVKRASREMRSPARQSKKLKTTPDEEAEDGEIREEGEMSDGSDPGCRANGLKPNSANSNSYQARVTKHGQAARAGGMGNKLPNSVSHARVPNNTFIPPSPRTVALGSRTIPPPPMLRPMPSPSAPASSAPLQRPTSVSSRIAAGPASRPVPPPMPPRPMTAPILRNSPPNARSPIHAPVGRSGPMPVRPSINPETLKTMRTGPPTSAPIIAMPHILPGGMGPMGMGGRGGIMGRGMGPAPIVPVGRGQYIGNYGIRNGNMYGAPVMFGPPGRIGGSMRHNLPGNYRISYNHPRGTLPITIPPPNRPGRPPPSSLTTSAGAPVTSTHVLSNVGTNTAVSVGKPNPPIDRTNQSGSFGSVNGERGVSDNVIKDKKAAPESSAISKPKISLNLEEDKDRNSEQHIKRRISASSKPTSKAFFVKDVENGEEGEIEEEGEIKEES